MTRIVVEVGFGYSFTGVFDTAFTDITDYVDIISAGVQTGRGASDELSDSQPGTCTIVLDNSDGRFTPARASSPYYPNVKRGVPIRVGVLALGGGKNYVEASSSSFENATIGRWSSAASTTDTSTVHASVGTRSLHLSWGAGAAGTRWTQLPLRGLDVGVTYTASLQAWVPSGSPAVRATVIGLATGTSSTLNDAWQQLTVTFTATSSSHTLRVETTGTAVAGNELYIDAVQVEAGSSATALAAGATMYWRHFGQVNEWPVSWDGLMSKVVVTCTDSFKWLARRDALQPMLGEEVLLDKPLAYYPMAEPAGSTSVGDLAGQGATALAIVTAGAGTTMTLSGGTGPAATGQSCPLFAPSSSTVGQYFRGDLGPQVPATLAAAGLFYEAWFATTVNGRVLMALTSADNSTQNVFLLESGTGKFRVEQQTSGGTATSYTYGTANLADGVMHHLVYDEENSAVWVDGVQVATLINVQTVTQVRYLNVGGLLGARLWDGRIAHVAVYSAGLLFASDLTGHYTAGTTGYSGETSDARVTRIASYAGLFTTATGGSYSAIASQGALGSSALAHLQEVEATEGGRLTAARDTAGVLFQSRALRYNPTPAFTLAYADLDQDSVEFADDDQKMVNTVVASRPGGATQRVVNQTSRDANGPYERQLDLLKTTDSENLDAANWLISRYADPSPEVREVSVEAYSLGDTLYQALLSADVGTVFTITGLPTQAPASTLTVTVEGYTETIQYRQHHLQFHVSAAQTDTVWVLDSGAYSVLGSTTRLAY